jgi:predicted nucleic acid-binding protein
VSRWYLDASAALKLVVEEDESAALAAAIDADGPDLVACLLLETELRRAAQRIDGLTQEVVSGLLDGVALYEVPPSLFREAGLIGDGSLRSLDALHLAAAVRIGVDDVATYDARMADAARALGLRVVAPG